jgi:chorismate synthase
VEIRAWTAEAAGIAAPGPGEPGFDYDEAERNPLRIPHRETAERALELVEGLRAEGDSAGGIAACEVRGLPPGLGEPVFGKLDARLAEAMLSLGAAKGIEFGAGFAAARGRGSALNDQPLPGNGEQGTEGRALPVPHSLLPTETPDLRFETNYAGGVLGGISVGMPGAALEFRVAFKPVPSISKPQRTVDRSGAARELIIQGRHDVCLVPRAVPVVEAMAALVLADLVLLHRGSRV